jgi:hypothetical protein
MAMAAPMGIRTGPPITGPPTTGPLAMGAPATDHLTLAQWLSPAFPVSSYAYSHGLEAAIASGAVADGAGAATWIATVIEAGSGRTDAILLAAALRDGADLDALSDIARALAGSAERWEETRAQGAAFAATRREMGADGAGPALPGRGGGGRAGAVAFPGTGGVALPAGLRRDACLGRRALRAAGAGGGAAHPVGPCAADRGGGPRRGGVAAGGGGGRAGRRGLRRRSLARWSTRRRRCGCSGREARGGGRRERGALRPLALPRAVFLER